MQPEWVSELEKSLNISTHKNHATSTQNSRDSSDSSDSSDKKKEKKITKKLFSPENFIHLKTSPQTKIKQPLHTRNYATSQQITKPRHKKILQPPRNHATYER